MASGARRGRSPSARFGTFSGAEPLDPRFLTFVLVSLAFTASAAEVRADVEPGSTRSTESTVVEAETEPETPAPLVPEETDEAPRFGARASVDAPIRGLSSLDATAAATVVDLRRRAGTGETMRDFFPTVPGARAVGLGAEGQFVGVALRGADLVHTTVLLGDMPLAGPDAGAFDVGLLPLASLGRIEVYRGAAPVWIGDGAIGGVVRLMPRTGEGDRAEASLGFGSFGTYRLGGVLSASTSRVSLLTAFGFDGTRGDFPYHADNNTRLDPSDDFTTRRDNADSMRGHGLAHARWELSAGTVELLFLGVSRESGVPGPGSRPSPDVRQSIASTWGAASFTRHVCFASGRAYRLQIRLGAGQSRNRFADPLRQFGIERHLTDDHTYGVDGRIALEATVASFLDVITVLAARFDRYAPDDLYAYPGNRPSDRVSGHGAIEARAHGRLGRVPVELRPSITGLFTRARIRYNDLSVAEERDIERTAPVVRVGLAIAPVPWLALQAATYTGARMPSVLELFGNRNLLRPNPELRMERATGVDGGGTVRFSTDAVRLVAEARVFHVRYEDFIRIERTSQFQARAENVDAMRATGLETGVTLDVSTKLAIAGQLGYLRTRVSPGGYDVPLRPRLTSHVRATYTSGRLTRLVADLSAYAELTHTGANYVDNVADVSLPARTWIGAGVGARFFDGSLAFDLSVRDLADARGTDLLGYPLPGRRVFFSIAYRTEL